MRVVLLAIAALSLAGCDHMYGGMDAGRFTTGAAGRISDADLLTIAERALAKEKRSIEGMTAGVLDRGSVWVVHFQVKDPGVLDGGVAVLIDKKTRRVTGISEDA